MTPDDELDRRLRNALDAVADAVTDHAGAAPAPPPSVTVEPWSSSPRSTAGPHIAPRHPAARQGSRGARRRWALPVSVAAVVAVAAATVGLVLAGSGSDTAPARPGAPGSTTGNQVAPTGSTVPLPGSPAASTTTTSVPASVPASPSTGP